MDVSIIIPVYNAKKYLARCIESVIKALSNYKGKSEVLLIDNNSSDNSLKIAEEFAKKYPKMIKVYKYSKPGASAVRNYGLNKSSGKYIWFVDADDEIASESVGCLMKIAKLNGADLIMMGAKRFFLNGNTQYLKAIDSNNPDFKSIFIRYGMGPWQVLIRRKWFMNNGFKFKEGIIHEDMEMMPALILHTDRFTSVDKPLYYYYENSGSVLHKSNWDPHYLDIFPALEGLYGRFEEANAIEKFHDELEWFFIWNLMLDSAKDFSRGPDGRIGFSQTRKIMKKYFPKWHTNKYLKNANFRNKIKIILNYYKK